MNNKLLRLLILIAVGLVIGGGSLFHPYNFNPSSSLALTPNAQGAESPSYSSKTKSSQSPDLPRWKSFKSEEYGFEFRYPPDGNVQTYGATEGKKVRVDLKVAGETLMQEKFFLIKVEKVSERSPSTPLGKEPGKEVFINDRKFVKKEFKEGAAGHLYEHILYSTIEGDRRFVLDFVLHSVNPGVFESPPPGFDWKETIVFSKISSTFRLLS